MRWLCCSPSAAKSSATLRRSSVREESANLDRSVECRDDECRCLRAHRDGLIRLANAWLTSFLFGGYTEPLITEKEAKDLFSNLLYGQKKQEPPAQTPESQIIKESASSAAPSAQASSASELDREETEEELDAAVYLEDDAEREKAFKARYVHLHNEVHARGRNSTAPIGVVLTLSDDAQCVKLSVLAHPVEGADVFLLVATPSSKIFSFTTPKLQPMIKTPVGQNMIRAFLNSKPLPTVPHHDCSSHS